MGCAFSASRGPREEPRLLYQSLTRPGKDASLAELQQNVDVKKLAKLIRQGRLAPIWPPEGAPCAQGEEECPICATSYPSMNTASCCSARICTECFVFHQTAAPVPGRALCPFCKCSPFAVRYLGRKPQEQLLREKQDEHSFAEAKRRQQQQSDAASVQQPDQQRPREQAQDGSSGRAQQPGAADAVAARAPDASPRWQQPGAAQQPQPGAVPQTQAQVQQQQQQQQQQQGWLEQLVARGGRRVEMRVFAGYSGGGDRLQPDLPGGDAADAAEAAAGAGEHDALQPQPQPALPAAGEQLEQLAQAGLVPRYVASQLWGLALEELDEILLEQGLLASLTPPPAAARTASPPAPSAAALA